MIRTPSIVVLLVVGMLGLAACGGDNSNSTVVDVDVGGDENPGTTPVPPEVTANAGPDRDGSAGVDILLNGAASTTTGSEPLTYAWSLALTPPGSGATLASSDTEATSFFADVAGDYRVTLRVTSEDVSHEDDVVIHTCAPVADAGSGGIIVAGETFVLDGSASVYQCSGTLSYQWTLVSAPAGSNAGIFEPTAQTTSLVTDLDGDYEVELVVDNGVLQSQADPILIRATTIPVADAGPSRTFSQGATVLLDGSLSASPNGSPLAYTWTLVSRPPTSNTTLSSSTIVNPTVTLNSAGEYVFALTVSNGQNTSAESRVTLTAVAPIAQAGADASVSVNETVVLDGRQSTDVEGRVLAMSWTVMDRPAASVALLSDTTAPNPSFMPDEPGTYLFGLIVNNGLTDSALDQATVTATVPTARAGADINVATGSVVSLDASASADPDGNSLSYVWQVDQIPATSLSALSSLTQPNPSFITDLDGTYAFTLRVNNGLVTSEPDSIVVTSTTAPVADAGPDQSVSTNQVVTLDGSASADSNMRPLIYNWTLQSNPSGSGAAISSNLAVSPTFIADQAGTFVACLVVNNAVENSLEDCVEVVASSPIADAGAGFNVTPGAAVTLDGRASSDPNAIPLTFAWVVATSPIGSTPSLAPADAETPVFSATTLGEYVIELTVGNGFVSSVADTVVVNVRASVGNTSGVFSTDFEDSALNTQWAGSNGVWETGSPTSGPGETYIGSNVAATILDGNYPDHVSSRLEGPAIQLPVLASGETLALRFWHWFSFYPGRSATPSTCNNGSPQDSAALQLAVEESPGTFGAWQDLRAFTLNSNDWTASDTDISSFAGQRIKLGFMIINPPFTISCTNGTRAGWYVDEVLVEVR